MIQPCIGGAFSPRTDLANECLELHFGNTKPDIDGIISRSETRHGKRCDILEITNSTGAVKLAKPIGKYITLDVGKITLCTRESFEELVNLCAETLSDLLPEKGSCLIACLGNRKITADAQGPLCADYLIVSRHIKENTPKLFSSLELAETMCIVPDVLGNTGIEAAHTVKGIVESIKPDFVIAVDSLAARKSARVGTTVQMSNAGIAPGSGIGNHRAALNRKTLGVPVISIGVPTVVDAVTVCTDVLEQAFSEDIVQNISEDTKNSILKSVLQNGSYGYFVTPKNADDIAKAAARLIGFSVNKALNPGLTISEMEELIG